jgi:pSer/pThr/pTyr-binding forkhead associated (FHA) protein
LRLELLTEYGRLGLEESYVYLKALSPESRNALGGQFYRITRFPFKVGRESRSFALHVEYPNSRRKEEPTPNNDLYLVDPGTILNVSREHFLIDRLDDGYSLVDRGSSCGTLVEGERIGERKKGGSTRLANNDVIIVGTSESRYIFKFILSNTEIDSARRGRDEQAGQA